MWQIDLANIDRDLVPGVGMLPPYLRRETYILRL